MACYGDSFYFTTKIVLKNLGDDQMMERTNILYDL
jgi:hypothetical protein